MKNLNYWMSLCLIMYGCLCFAATTNPVKVQMLQNNQTCATVLYSDKVTPTFERPVKTTPQNVVNGNLVTVTCLRDCGENDENYNPRDWQYTFIDKDGNIWWCDGWDAEDAGTPGKVQIQVPEGIYDIVVSYYYDVNPRHYCHIIHEQVELINDTSLSVCAEEANIQIQFKPYLPTGEECYPETVLIHEDGSPQEVIEEGTVENLVYTYNICLKNGTNLYSASGNWANIWTGARDRDATHGSDIFINQVSDRIAFGCTMAFPRYNFDGSYYVVDFEVSTCKDTIVSNKPEDYISYEKTFKHTPYGQHCELYPGLGFSNADEHRLMGGWRLLANDYTLANDEPCRYFLCKSHEDAVSPIHCFISPQVGDGENPWASDIKTLVRDPFTAFDDEGLVHIYKGLISIGNNIYSVKPNPDAASGYTFFPTSNRPPIHTFDVAKMKTITGNSCPIMVQDLRSEVLPTGGIQKSLYFNAYIGRNGEVRESDWYTPHSVIKVDGETIGEGDMLTYFNWTTGDQGLVDIVTTNENVDVDGIPGKNVTSMHFDMAGNDDLAPTLQMLDFRDTEGNSIDRFATGDQGTLQFYCGDFNEQYIDNEERTQYFICNDLASVEVAYSPYQEDNWTPIDANEVAEYYFDGLGHYYATPLASVTGEALNGWFDLKIRLTDAAGNWQEQVISPAFCIDNLAYSGIVTPRGDNIREVARYSLDGKRVDMNHRGVTIVKMSDGTARKVIQ